MNKKRKIAVVGAGIGGLAVAARLASKGFEVDVYEKLPECGGRAHIIEDKGFKFDTGPSFILMPDFFEEVFFYCKENLSDYLRLKFLDIHYHIFYPSGEKLTIFNNSQKTKAELEKFEEGASAKYDAFIKETERFYQPLQPLLYKCFTPKDFLNTRYWNLISKLKPFQTYWQVAKKYFKSDAICYAMTFEAMFIGVSPFKTPAFYSIITYTDHVQKISHPLGGIYEVPRALEKMAKKFGARFHYNQEIRDIVKTNGTFTLSNGENKFEADRVVVNADYASTQTDLLKRRIPNYEYSCSVYLLYLGLKTKVKRADHHNLFFAEDLNKNLDAIFRQKKIPEDPSFYIHVPTVTDPSLAPEGKDIFYLLVPVPNFDGNKEDFETQEEKLRRIVFERINKTLSIDLDSLIEVEHKFLPVHFVSRYNIKHAATFGLAHTLMQSAFFRPANIDSLVKGLYYVGASVQPGGGMPPVIAGSRIVADEICKKED